MPETTPAPTPEPQSGKGGKLVPILLVVNSLLLAGVVAFLLLRPGPSAEAKGPPEPAAEAAAEHGEGGAEAAEAAAPTAGPGPVVQLDDFVVHLRNPEANRYARLSFGVELGADGDRKVFKERDPMIRDAVIGYLSDRTAEELTGSEGLARMKKELLAAIDQVVPGRRVRALYVTALVIQ